MVVSWYTELQSHDDHETISVLEGVYSALMNLAESGSSTGTILTARKATRQITSDLVSPEKSLFAGKLDTVAGPLLVAIHACSDLDDWSVMLAHVWDAMDAGENVYYSVSTSYAVSEIVIDFSHSLHSCS